MVLRRRFEETLQARARVDPAFRDALLEEAVACLLAGELDAGKSILRGYVNATIGFEALARLTGTPAKSLMRMLGPRGNPQARRLLAIVAALQQETGTTIEVRVVREPAPAG